MAESHDVAIIGAGFSGLGMAIRLGGAGRDHLVLERGDDVGGTWWANTYPGCRCDVPSHLYSFSFAPNPGWSRTYSAQPEILEYLRGCAQRFRVTPRIRLRCEVRAAAWEDGRWRLDTSHGPMSARVLVVATGPLSAPAVPDLPGLEGFAGSVMHSAAWDDDVELDGRSVAIVGTGASAAQLAPAIAPRVGRLHVFQRTPPWVLPHADRAITAAERRLFAAVPGTQRAIRGAVRVSREAMVPAFHRPRLMREVQRLAEGHLRRQVRDPALRARLRPAYRLGCKRVVLSNAWYPTLTRPGVEVVDAGVAAVRRHAVVGADGREIPVDVLVLATGFHVGDPPVASVVRGRGGRSLAETWRGTPRSYRGTTFTGFPNLFMLIGPNTGLGTTSVVLMAEAQMSYVLDALRVMDERRARAVEVRPAAQDAFDADVQRRLAGTVWTTGGCTSWYQGRDGRTTALWPRTTWAFERQLARFDPKSYAIAA